MDNEQSFLSVLDTISFSSFLVRMAMLYIVVRHLLDMYDMRDPVLLIQDRRQECSLWGSNRWFVIASS